MSQVEKINLPDSQWRKRLSPEVYHILREKGTEPPFSGKYYHHKEKGTYHCAGCGALLFTSEAKYESGSGWPSFYKEAVAGAIDRHPDYSYGMVRTEITCARCGGHLGHVFDDGPPPTGLRFCVNSLALEFRPSER
ncbi:MAG: peptide-methionine (R)-S-oxide reductase MsrB [Leptospiraceae bacterium]|nr:peptide-methionine (R)-S-oxide reductase MsrB [Leptospiraceae bacterium]MDW8307352.1 peptide-methionine (R)-S-oxide reductase MsrB [Leptospiraceae bacterium]